jgi:hypothetical protein
MIADRFAVFAGPTGSKSADIAREIAFCQQEFVR